MTDSEILVEAFKRGRSWGPDYPNLLNLDEAAVAKMDGSEADAKELIRSLQQSDANYDPLVLAWHKRPPEFDGEIGPATKGLVQIPRCPLPDFPPPPGMHFAYDDPGIQAAVESMQRAAAMGSGSWPSCDPERTGVNSFRVRIDPSRMPSTINGYHKQALDAVVAAYAEMGCALRYIMAASGDCEIAKLFQSLAGSVIGWNEFPDPGTCNQTINGRLDTGYAPSDYRYWANLECHETGHGVGLQHTRGHIMNPSILLVWPLSWKGGPSEASMRRYFGGEPLLPPGPAPVPAHPSVTGSLFGEQFAGGFVIRGDVQFDGKWKYVAAPDGVGNKYKLVPKAEV